MRKKRRKAKPKRYKTARCILYRDDHFLLANHNARRRVTRWGLPGGHVEWREAPEDCARREVYEELNIYLGELLPVGDYVYKQRLHAVFAAKSDVWEFELDFSELAEVQWFRTEEIARLNDFDQLHAGYEYQAVLALKTLQKTA